MNGKAVSYCDECGRCITKASRVYKGARYCATCYARTFKHRRCPLCGEMARLPKFDQAAVCKKCETKGPCIRCGKVEYKVGKVTPYGPVCKSCSVHFRAPRTCALCGALSKYLITIELGSKRVKVCNRCGRKAHGVCQACHRYRPLFTAPDGLLLCKHCLEKGEITCHTCGKLMPAGRGTQCDECYWTQTFRKRVQIDCATFSNPILSKRFNQFGEWLLARVGSHKAALTIHKYLPFFLSVQENWPDIPSYHDLISVLGTAYLRRFLLPVRWCEAERGLVIDLQEKVCVSEKRRIESLILSLPSESEATKVLVAYKAELLKRYDAGKTSMLSIRLALRPAASLLMQAIVSGKLLPDQSALDEFLLGRPGQKAAVTGFVNFLEREKGIQLVIRIDTKTVRARKQAALEKKIFALMHSGVLQDGMGVAWIKLAMEYFYDVKVKKNSLITNLKPFEDGFSVFIENHEYFLPRLKRNRLG